MFIDFLSQFVDGRTVLYPSDVLFFMFLAFAIPISILLYVPKLCCYRLQRGESE